MATQPPTPTPNLSRLSQLPTTLLTSFEGKWDQLKQVAQGATSGSSFIGRIGGHILNTLEQAASLKPSGFLKLGLFAGAGIIGFNWINNRSKKNQEENALKAAERYTRAGDALLYGGGYHPADFARPNQHTNALNQQRSRGIFGLGGHSGP